jgi:hypothetical protein
MLEKNFGKWQYSTLVSFILFYASFWLVNTFPHSFAYYVYAILLAIIGLVLFIIIQSKHRNEAFWLVLISMSLSSGMAAGSVMLHPEANYLFSWDRVYVFFGVVFLWTTIIRLIPFRKLLSLFVTIGFIVTLIMGLASYDTAPHGPEMLFLSVFYLPISISLLVYLKTDHSLERIFALGYFGSFLVVLLVAAIVLSEGEALSPVLEGVGEVVVEGVAEVGVSFHNASKNKRQL